MAVSALTPVTLSASAQSSSQAKPAVRTKPLSQRLSCISTALFYLGLILIPFDNLPFAPSPGWATVAPIVFFAYVCFNLSALGRIRFNKAYALGMIVLFALQAVNLFFYGITLSALMDTLETFTLGLFFYLALIIRYETQKASFNKDATILYRAYIVAFLYGVVWLCAFNFNPALDEFFQSIERRYYDRLAFSFTEPSFISMHVYGVLFLFTYFVSDRKLARKMIVLGFLFVVLSIVCKSSARAIVDLGVFAILLLARTTWLDRQHSARNLLLWAVVIGACVVAVLSSSRIQRILMGGFDVDGSMSSRLFRIECMVYGFLQDPLGVAFGYGPGNMIVPFQAGYDQAFMGYTNSFMKEVNYLGEATAIDNMFCMPVRLISDFGLFVSVGFLILIVYLAWKKRIDPCVVLMTLWLYIQSDSYAFYSLWMLFYLFRAYDPRTMGVSYFAVFEKRKRKRAASARATEPMRKGRTA